MSKTCNLFTVRSTPHEVRMNTSTVVYYFIDYEDDRIVDIAPQWHTLRDVIDAIWDALSVSDLLGLDGLNICAYMSDNTIRPIRRISVDVLARHMCISRV